MDTTTQADQVIEKILEEARSQAQQLKAQALQRQAEQKAALDQALAQFKQQTDAMAAKAAQDQIDHILAQARMGLAKELLAQKRRILDEVFSQVAQRIKTMPADQYRDLIGRLIIQLAKGDEELIVDKDETRIDQALVDHVNKTLSSMGRPAGIRLSQQRRPIGAGFILQKGRIRTNCSLDVIIGQIRMALESELATELFA